MAMGKRRRQANQAAMWVATDDLPRSAAHPFYTRLNQMLDKHHFDGTSAGRSGSQSPSVSRLSIQMLGDVFLNLH